MAPQADGSDGEADKRRFTIELFHTYTSVLAVITAALLLVTSGVAKRQLVWKQPRPIRVRRWWHR